MSSSYWADGFKGLLNPKTLWGKHFISHVIGKEFADYDIIFDGIEVKGLAKEYQCSKCQLFDIYVFSFDNIKRLYITFVSSHSRYENIRFIVKDTDLQSEDYPFTLAINILNKKGGNQNFGSANFYFADKSALVKYSYGELASIYPALSDIVAIKDMSKFSDLLLSFESVASVEVDSDLYKVCSIIASEDSYS